MNKQKGLLHTLAFTLFLFMGMVALFAHNPTPVHAFAGDYALEFDDSDLVILDETITIMGTHTWTETKTVSLWVKPTGTPYCFSPADPARCDNIFGDRARWWGISHGVIGGQDRIWVWNYDGNYDSIGVPYTVGEWTHITLVHDSNILYAYKNGVLVNQIASGPTQLPNTGAQPTLYIGGMIINDTNRNFTFEGEIDEVQIWNVARTGDQIRQDMYRTLSPQPGLAAYYQMSNGSGTALTDNSGNGHHGTLLDGANNSPPYPGTDGIPPQWIASGAFAGPRNALAFDGVDDVVALNVDAEDVFGSGWASVKTAELWAYPTGFATSVTNAADGDILIGNAHWGIARADIGGADRLWLYNNDGNEARVGIPYASDEWAHFALVHDGGNLNAYKNGALVGSVPSGNTANDADLLIGSGFEGRLDELRLWDSARSAQQIRENMFQTVSHNETGLAAYYRFDQQNDASVTTVYDTAVSSHHGTMTNMTPAAAWVASTAFNTWIGSQSSDWSDGANWSRYAVPGLADSVGVPSYPNSQGLVLSDTLNIKNLYVAPDASLTITGAGQLGASGTLISNGKLQQTLPVVASTDVHFLNINNYGGVILNAQANLGDTLVSIRDNVNCTTAPGPAETVLRCFDISPETNGDSANATITFYFRASELGQFTCSQIEVYHWDEATQIWGQLTRDSNYGVDGRDCASQPHSIRVTGVSDFSPFVLAADNTPTAVQLNGLGVGETAVLPITFLLLALILLLPTARLLNGRRQTG